MIRVNIQRGEQTIEVRGRLHIEEDVNAAEFETETIWVDGVETNTFELTDEEEAALLQQACEARWDGAEDD
ncbi:hypothetical protein Rctr197k_278 [Virus Rctr197k]|nr:hypothetical protein Rctr197k_278 [Virus Rctr197k]